MLSAEAVPFTVKFKLFCLVESIVKPKETIATGFTFTGILKITSLCPAITVSFR